MISDSNIQPNKKEVININNIFFEDSFIDLINNLSSSIGDLYKTSVQLIKSSHQLIFPFESNLSQLLSLSSSKPELFSIIKELTIIKEKIKMITNSTNENIEIFKENAKKIFAEMKNQKKNKVDALYNDYARKHSLKNEQQKINLDPLRKSNPNNEIKRNKTLNKASGKKSNTSQNKLGFNFNLIKNLVNKLGEYNNIIKNHSVNDYENFNKIQKQLSTEINRFINMNIMKNIEGDDQKRLDTKTELDDKNPFMVVNNNSNNVTMTTTNNNSYYNIIDKDNIKELKSASFHGNSKSDVTNEINIINNKNIFLEKKLKEYEEEMKKIKEDYELNYKILNDKNTSLSKDLVNKNHEIQMLQNSNKQKISEITKLKLIQKNNEKQLRVKKAKAEQQREKSPGNIKIKDLLGNKNNVIENKNNEDELNNNNKEQIKKLEEELKTLKDTINKKDENISNLEKDVEEVNNKNQSLKEEINYKDIKINDDDKLIINLRSEKDKLVNKIKEHKNLEESYKIQLDSLKVQIKEMNRQLKEEDLHKNKSNSKKDLKKQNNELKCENVNLQYRLEYELNFNKQLKEDVKKKELEIDGLQIFIKKLMKEKELNSLNKELTAELLKRMDSNKRINTDSGHKFERDDNTNKKNIMGKYDNATGKFNLEKEQNISAEVKKDFINK